MTSTMFEAIASELTGNASSRRKIRTIVADDRPDWFCLVGALLNVEDYVDIVARVEDGQQAIEAVTSLQPDLLIIDVGIGSIDGITAASLLCHHFPSLNVILIANQDSPRLRATCRASGAKYFIRRANFDVELPPILFQIKNSLRRIIASGMDF